MIKKLCDKCGVEIDLYTNRTGVYAHRNNFTIELRCYNPSYTKQMDICNKCRADFGIPENKNNLAANEDEAIIQALEEFVLSIVDNGE